jgi:WD40 repeat protein
MPSGQGHQNGITVAAVVDKGLCTGGRDRRVLLWSGGDGDPGLRLNSEVALGAEVTALLFHASSTWLFCGLGDGQIRASRQSPPADCMLAGHTLPVTCLLAHEDVLLSGSLDGTISAWRYDEGSGSFQRVSAIQSPAGPVLALGMHLPGGIWVCGERGISCLSAETMEPLGAIETPAPPLKLLSYQGRALAALTNGMVKVFDSSGKEEFSHGPLGEHTTTRSVAVLRHPREQKDLLLCGQDSGYVTAYAIPEFTPRGSFQTGFQGAVTAILDLGTSDGTFVTCGLSGDVVVWRWE